MIHLGGQNSTRGISETRLEILYRHSSSLMRHIKNTSRLYVEIFDYPGEWLLDLPLLELNYQKWSESIQALHNQTRDELAKEWLTALNEIDLLAEANEAILASISAKYTAYLHQCKAEGLQMIQPGRFVLPGEFEGAPAIQFFPLQHLTVEQWHELEKQSGKKSYFQVLKKRYNYYRDKIVKSFYEDHFSKFDRQIILVDCLTPLNHSQFAFNETEHTLLQLFKNFNYGNRSLWKRLFDPQIDKLLFVASKADHVTLDQLDNLKALLRSMVQQGAKQKIGFSGIEIDYSALAAIRATSQVMVHQDGNNIKALKGIRSRDLQEVVLYPGTVPPKLPTAKFWQDNKYEFDDFEPQIVHDENIPHLRMDAVLQFLLGDKLD